MVANKENAGKHRVGNISEQSFSAKRCRFVNYFKPKCINFVFFGMTNISFYNLKFKSAFMRSIFIACMLFMSIAMQAQNYREVKFEQLDSLIQSEPAKLHVVNFWATWCKPCVQELPYFKKASIRFKNEDVKFIFISLDFQGQINNKLVPFLNSNELPGEVWWLNERKLHKMIDRVEASWSGAIPFTFFLKGSKEGMEFKEGELNYDELEKMIHQNI
jgi:thiol-disulfide isomerase/thioredoxin